MLDHVSSTETEQAYIDVYFNCSCSSKSVQVVEGMTAILAVGDVGVDEYLSYVFRIGSRSTLIIAPQWCSFSRTLVS